MRGIFTSGPSLSSITKAITDLENANATHPAEFFESIASGTSGTLSIPAGHVIQLNQWAGGVDGIVSGISGGVPDGTAVLDASGEVVTTTLDSVGAWAFSSEPASYPVAIVADLLVEDTRTIIDNASLVALADASGLTPGQKYQVTFRPRTLVWDDGETKTYWTGADETLLLEATSADGSSPMEGWSVTYPSHRVQYLIDASAYYGPSGENGFSNDGPDQGAVIFRHDTSANIEMDFDWLAVRSRLWESAAESGVYNSATDPGSGAAYIDRPIWPSNGQVAEVAIFTHRNSPDGSTLVPAFPFNIVFAADYANTNGTVQIYKFRTDYGTETIIVSANDALNAYVTNIHTDCCCQLYITGTAGNTEDFRFERTTMPTPGGRITAEIPYDASYTWGGGATVRVEQEARVYGILDRCTILPTFPVDGVINGIHEYVEFGSESRGPGVLGPELISVPTADQPDSAAAWSGETITGGNFVFTGEETQTETTPIVAVAGASYLLEIQVDDYTSGDFASLSIGGTAATMAVDGAGLWREVITATNTAGLSIANNYWTGAISRVSVRRVGGASPPALAASAGIISTTWAALPDPTTADQTQEYLCTDVGDYGYYCRPDGTRYIPTRGGFVWKGSPNLPLVVAAATFTGLTYNDNGGNVQIQSAGVHGLTDAKAAGANLYVSWAAGTGVDGYYPILTVDSTLLITIDVTHVAGLGTPTVSTGAVFVVVEKTLPGGVATENFNCRISSPAQLISSTTTVRYVTHTFGEVGSFGDNVISYNAAASASAVGIWAGSEVQNLGSLTTQSTTNRCSFGGAALTTTGSAQTINKDTSTDLKIRIVVQITSPNDVVDIKSYKIEVLP